MSPSRCCMARSRTCMMPLMTPSASTGFTPCAISSSRPSWRWTGHSSSGRRRRWATNLVSTRPWRWWWNTRRLAPWKGPQTGIGTSSCPRPMQPRAGFCPAGSTMRVTKRSPGCWNWSSAIPSLLARIIWRFSPRFVERVMPIWPTVWPVRSAMAPNRHRPIPVTAIRRRSGRV